MKSIASMPEKRLDTVSAICHNEAESCWTVPTNQTMAQGPAVQIFYGSARFYVGPDSLGGIMDAKRCSNCRDTKPLDAFNKNRDETDGYQRWCKECRRTHRTENKIQISEQKRAFRAEHRDEINTKKRDAWNANSEEINKQRRDSYQGNKDKLRSQKRVWAAEHRTQLNEANKLYYQNHKEEAKQYRIDNRNHIAERKRLHRIANLVVYQERASLYRNSHKQEMAQKQKDRQELHPGKCREIRRKSYLKHRDKRLAERHQWYRENREHALEMSRQYHEAHKDEILERMREWREAHPEVSRMGTRKRRALAKNLKQTFSHEHELFVHSFWNNQCAICKDTGSEMPLEIDHWFPLAKGYPLSMGNAVLLCRSCNSRKYNKWPQEVFAGVRVLEIELRLIEQIAEWVTSEARKEGSIA